MSRATPQNRLRSVPAALAVLLATTGCQAQGPIARWRASQDGSGAALASKTRDDLVDDRGLMARWLDPHHATKSTFGQPPASTIMAGSDGWGPAQAAADKVAEAEFEVAEQLFRRGKLAEAEKEFARVAKKRKETPVGERAQYFLAETQFQRNRLVAAHDSYETLFAVYPGTRYLEKAVAREYTIAETWMANSEGKAPPGETLSWRSRFNGTLPLVDVSGHAIAALDHVRIHFPDGPLADDAVMRIADHHYLYKDYESAGEHYDQLIAEAPKSPFVQKARLASIDSKVKAYLGPEYDGAGLEQAKEAIKQTMITFPDRQASTSDKLYHTLDLIRDQRAERAFLVAKYYKEAGAVDSAEFYYAMIAQRWPESPWAAKSKVQLATLAKAPRKAVLPSKIMTTPGSSDPVSGGMGGGAGMGGMGMQAGANGFNGSGN